MMSAASLDQALASSTQIRNSKASQESNAILLDAKIKLTPIATVDINFFFCGPRTHAGCGKFLCQLHMRWINYSDGFHDLVACSDGCDKDAHNACCLNALWFILLLPMCTCGWSKHKKLRAFVDGQVVERDG